MADGGRLQGQEFEPADKRVELAEWDRATTVAVEPGMPLFARPATDLAKRGKL
jgi:hypothetical protein